MKSIRIITPIIILLILLVIIKKTDTFSSEEQVSDDKRNEILSKIKNFNNKNLLNENEIVISRINKKLVIKNYTQLNNLTDFLFQRNLKTIKLKTNKENILKYETKPLEHTNTLSSGYLVSHKIKTNPKNKKYGFVLTLDDIDNSICEFSIDFSKNQQANIQTILNIDQKVNSANYKTITRKSINLFTKGNCPDDLLPYFNDEVSMIGRFLGPNNEDFLDEFPDRKFNILDNNLNPVLTKCILDIPYCKVNLDKKGNVLGRDNYIVGKFNHINNQFGVLDSDKYTTYKKKRAEGNKAERDALKLEELTKLIDSLKGLEEEQLKWDALTVIQRKDLKEHIGTYDFYKTISLSKIIELSKTKEYHELTPEQMDLVIDFGEQDKFGSFGPNPSESFVGEINQRYRNMTEHFSNEISFKGDKYLEYDNMKTCQNQENRIQHLNKYSNQEFSSIFSNDTIIKDKQEVLQKIKDLSGFQCRKHYSPTEDTYFYGGIDNDGISKCYGSNQKCELYSKEECLQKEKDITQVKEDFTNMNYWIG